MQFFEGKTVLATGAGGSIGSQLCRLVMSDNAKRLVLVSLTESGLYEIHKKLEREYRKYRDTELVPVLASAGDIPTLARHLAGVDIVIHAAAHKHLPMCERNPVAAIENNVINTWLLIEAAIAAKVSQFCMVSSDKAVNPKSIMGATKRVGELLVGHYAKAGPRMSVVRFGNVLDSAGSVLPLWREQVEAKVPITITDERCERYFMEICDAVTLIALALQIPQPGGTFVIDMGKPIKLVDLAKDFLKKIGFPKHEVQIIGLRPGEKVTEELHYGGEIERSGDRLLRVIEPILEPIDLDAVRNLRDFVVDRNEECAVDLLWQMVR